jgi:hypothetical protein
VQQTLQRPHRLAVITAVAVGALVAAPSIASAHTAQRSVGHHATVVNLDSLHFRYGGANVSARSLDRLQRSGHAKFVVVDPESAARGEGHAFDNMHQLRAFDRTLNASSRSATAAAAAVPDVSGCPGLSYGIRFYWDNNCGGNYLSMNRNDQIPHMSTYGWNDEASSILLQNSNVCSIEAVLYDNANYDTTDGVIQFYGSTNAASYNLGTYGWNDRVSSAKTYC